MSKRYNLAFTIAYSVLSVCLVTTALWYIIEPKRSLQLLPSRDAAIHLYADSIEPSGSSQFKWLDRSSVTYECDIGYGIEYPYCGLVIKFKKPNTTNMEAPDEFDYQQAWSYSLLDYDTIELSLEYEGDSPRLNFFLRTGHPLPKNFAEYEKKTYLYVPFSSDRNQVKVSIADLTPPSWWVEKMALDPDPEHIDIDLSHVFEIGLDLPPKPSSGAHTFQLKRVVASKLYIPSVLVQSALLILISLMAITGVLHLLLKRTVNKIDKENQSLREKVNADPLTQCLNRTGLDTIVTRIFPLLKEAKMYVIVLDIDHFKNINDTYGHAVGDEILKQTAESLTDQLRKEDVLGRWGGEEFVIITRLEDDHIDAFISRLMQSLTSITFDKAPHDFQVTMSVGVSEVRIREPFKEAFERADEAMYVAKTSGRNAWRMG